MKGVIALVLFIGGLIGLFYYNLHSKKENWNYLINQGVKTVGTVSVKYKGVDILYTANGKSYTRSIGSKPRGIIDGERYTVFYNRNEPQKSVVDFYSPVFDSLQFSKICIDEFEKISGKDKGLIKFEYVLEGKKVTRFHKAKLDIISSTGPYEVWLNNSDHRVLYLTGKSCAR